MVSLYSRFARDSVHFVMRADRKQKDCFGAAVLHELEDDSEVIASAGRPIACQIAFEFVCS